MDMWECISDEELQSCLDSCNVWGEITDDALLAQVEQLDDGNWRPLTDSQAWASGGGRKGAQLRPPGFCHNTYKLVYSLYYIIVTV